MDDEDVEQVTDAPDPATASDDVFSLSFSNPQLDLQTEPLGDFVKSLLSKDGDDDMHEFQGKLTTTVEKRRARVQKSTRGAVAAVQDRRELTSAVEQGNPSLCLDLIRSGGDVNYQDDKKRTLLHIAAAKGHPKIVAVLLEYGADPNRKDVLQNTPLHLAACTSRIPVVTELLRGGANADTLDLRGNSPLQLARGRLKLLFEKQGTRLKTECIEVIDMIQVYLRSKNQTSEELTSFQERLEGNSEEVSELQDILDRLGSLNIQKSASADGQSEHT